MLPPEQPDRIQIAFDDHRLLANAGLLLPVTLAQRLGRSQLVDRHVDLGRAPGRQHRRQDDDPASALAGGETTPLRRAGRMRGAPWGPSGAASGGVKLDRVSRELLRLGY